MSPPGSIRSQHSTQTSLDTVCCSVSRDSDRALGEERFFLQAAEALAHVGSFCSSGLDGSDKVRLSNEGYRIFGIPEGTEIRVATFLASVHPDDAELVARARQAAAAGGTYDLEHRIVKGDGSVCWVRTKGTVGRDAHGRPRHMMGVVQDITAQKRAMDRLRESEARYRRIIETTNEGVWTIGAAANTTSINARMAAMLGYEPGEVIGKSLFDFVHGRDRWRVEAHLEQRCAGLAVQAEVPLKRQDGSTIWTLLDATPIFDANGAHAGVLAMVTDIAERRCAEEALRASEARFARLWESGIIGIAVADLEGRVYEANDACLEMLGYSRAELVAGQVRCECTETNLLRSLRQQLEECGVTTPFEHEVRRKDGTQRPCLVGVATLESPKTIVFLVDLSERKRAELALRESEDQLRQAQKMEAIGRLAGGVAHDFNNLLSVVLTYTTLALDTLAPDDPLFADLEQVRKAGERATTLTRQLLAFSRQQVLEPRVLDLNETLLAMEKMLRRIVGEDVALALKLSPNLGCIYADPGQIEQVIMNLVVNARDAMPTGGTLTLATSEFSTGSEPHVKVSVIDTGVGMDAATRSRIFEPFFTTKPKDKGTGLGLSTVLGIVEQSGGHIDVSSEPGVGTRFEIHLPGAAPGARSRASSVPPADMHGSETILIVEDEDEVRRLTATVLQRNGYRVLDAQNAGEALLISEEHAEPIHLLLTDVVMPRRSGHQLAQRLCGIHPDLQVLYMSGYSDGSIAPHGVHEESLPMLHKPIRPETLLRKVRDVLDASQLNAARLPAYRV